MYLRQRTQLHEVPLLMFEQFMQLPNTTINRTYGSRWIWLTWNYDGNVVDIWLKEQDNEEWKNKYGDEEE